ncbi:Eif4e2, partial [Symbiodinium microadriaticum]
EVFYVGQTRKEVDDRVIRVFGLFKKGITPEWEDPANSLGSELICRSIRSLDAADVYWENLVLGSIGETIDEGDEICGCRIANVRTGKPSIKVEVWLRTRNLEIADRIKARLLDAITDGESSKPSARGIPNFQYMTHGIY